MEYLKVNDVESVGNNRILTEYAKKSPDIELVGFRSTLRASGASKVCGCHLVQFSCYFY